MNKYKYKLHGRFKGRKRINNSLSNFIADYRLDTNKEIDKNKYTILDIGSGSGENSIYLSKINPNSNIIACDLFEDGNINLCNQIILNNIKTIFLFQGNVLELLDIINQYSVFDEIWISFPDPWPKIRHHKRRLINVPFLKLIYFSLKKNGKMMITSDSQSYIRSISRTVYECRYLFFWENQNIEEWNYDLLSLPRTKFNKKAIKSNRNSMIFKLNKI